MSPPIGCPLPVLLRARARISLSKDPNRFRQPGQTVENDRQDHCVLTSKIVKVRRVQPG